MSRWLRAAACAAWLAFAVRAQAQADGEMREVLARLERLEAQNRALLAKVEALQAALEARSGGATADAQPPMEERMAAQESRTTEQAQTKVEASERFPVRLTGMALFNLYKNSEYSGGAAFPAAAAYDGASGGATLRQTILGLDYFGPATFWGGKVSGAVRMDFFGGSGRALEQTFRLRTATISMDWKTRALRVGQDRSLLALRDPESLAQVGVSPLTGAGNLWLWLPQARVEQTLQFSSATGLRAQLAAAETSEANAVYAYRYGAAGTGPQYSTVTPQGRPAVEGRLEFFTGEARRAEFASAIHHSVSHVAGAAAATDVYSVDWLLRPFAPLEFTGVVFSGTNTAAIGGLQQGVVILSPGKVRAVRSAGGWAQLTWRAAPRVWMNAFAGAEDPRNRDLPAGAIARNLAYGANVFFRLAPNVIASLETHQYRTSYVAAPTLLSNHYDLALGYRF